MLGKYEVDKFAKKVKEICDKKGYTLLGKVEQNYLRILFQQSFYGSAEIFYISC